MAAEVCDVCGSTDIKEIKCKVICQNCGTILKSCADLSVLSGHQIEENRHGS
jgi:ribosomal protein L37AE/L43A